MPTAAALLPARRLVPLPAAADATVLPDWSGEQVSCLSFSPDGALLAAGGGDGGVGVWHLRGTAGRPALEVASSASLPPPPGGGPIGAVRWLAASEASGYVLLVGNKNNTALQLWHTPAADNPWTLLQTLIIQGKDGPLGARAARTTRVSWRAAAE